MAIPGNLLDENTESFETSLAGWEISGATGARLSGSVVPGGGSYVCRTTADGGDDTVMATAAPVPVLAGVEYLAYGHAMTQNRPVTVTAEIHWRDGSGIEIGSPAVHAESFGGTGIIGRRACAIGVAPAGAVTARVVMRATNGAAGDLTYWDQMFLGVAPNPEENLLGYEAYGFEAGLAGWHTPEATLSTVPNPYAGGEGYWTCYVVPNGPGDIWITQESPIPVVGGAWYELRFSSWMHAESNPTRVLTTAPGMRWLAADGGVISESRSDWASVSGENYPAWVRLTVYDPFQAPPGAAFGVPLLGLRHIAGSSVADYCVDVVQLREVPPAYEVDVVSGLGMVRVTIHQPADLDPALEVLSVERVEPDGRRYPVRGQGGDWTSRPIPTSSTVVIEDYEAPLATRIWYRIEYRSPGGGRRYLPTPVILGPTLPDSRYVWVKSPGMPARNRVVMVADNLLSWSRASRAAHHMIVGREHPVVVADRRPGRTGEISLYAWTLAESAALDALIEPELPLLIQAMPGKGLVGNLYVAVGATTESPLADTEDAWRWTWALTRVDRPLGGISGTAGRTWAALLAEHGTWEAVYEAYPTWARVLTGEVA